MHDQGKGAGLMEADDQIWIPADWVQSWSADLDATIVPLALAAAPSFLLYIFSISEFPDVCLIPAVLFWSPKCA